MTWEEAYEAWESTREKADVRLAKKEDIAALRQLSEESYKAPKSNE